MEGIASSNSNSTSSGKSDACSSLPVLSVEQAGRCQQEGTEECEPHDEIEMVYSEIQTRGLAARSVVFWRKERRFMRKTTV